MVLCFPYFMDNFIVLLILLPSTITTIALWNFLNIWISALFSCVDVYIENFKIFKEGMNCMKIIGNYFENSIVNVWNSANIHMKNNII
jgi:hypothetical protein